MGEDEQQQSPQLTPLAAPPTVGQLTDDAIAAQRKAFQAGLPQLGELGQELTSIQGRLLPQINQLNLDQRRIFGPALVGLAVDMAKQSDPSGFQLRQSLVDQIARNLGQGGALTPEEQRLAQEDIRTAQTNRGFGTGLNDALDEARFLGTQRFGREQARIQNALSTLAGANPGDKFMGLTNQMQTAQTPDVSGFAGNFIPSTAQFMGFGQQQAQQAAQNAMNWDQMNQQKFFNEYGTRRNPMKEDIGFGLGVAQGLGGIAGSIMGGMTGMNAAGGGLSAMGGMAGSGGAGGGIAGFGSNVPIYQPKWNQYSQFGG